MAESIKIEKSFTQVADAYQQFRPGYPMALYERLKQLVPPEADSCVLDVGCGTGNVTRELSKIYNSVCGIDPSEGMLDQARRVPVESINPIAWREGFSESLPFSEHVFDMITVAQAFHWFDADRFLEESKRVLKPNGLIAIFAEGPAPGMVYRSSIHKIIRNFKKGDREVSGRSNSGPRKKLDELLDAFGFSEVQKIVIEYDLEWDVDRFIGFMNSMSVMADFNDVERAELNSMFELKIKELTDGVNSFSEQNITTLFVGKV